MALSSLYLTNGLFISFTASRQAQLIFEYLFHSLQRHTSRRYRLNPFIDIPQSQHEVVHLAVQHTSHTEGEYGGGATLCLFVYLRSHDQEQAHGLSFSTLTNRNRQTNSC